MSDTPEEKKEWREFFGPDIPYSAETMVRTAIVTARPAKNLPRWLVVMNLFLYGQSTARKICEFYGFDPDEIIPADSGFTNELIGKL